ncbi:hypothetical protein [Paraferrimonas sp. SM1919]|uniref:hypothetical protein n=1 Tax=Paraferrimonas sp. SM1919 TaxID=2662263 RepID=UPI0013D87E5B|nr:hypothetical protein [Paraferrimonas sp. SM1919]
MDKLFAIFCWLIMSAPCSATLLINPTRAELDDKRNSSAVFAVINKSNKPARFNIFFEDKQQLADGTYLTLANEPYLNQLIRYSPRRVSLAPEQAANVRMGLRLTPNIRQGEYRSYLAFQQIPAPELKNESAPGDDISIKISALLKIAVPVIVRVGTLSADIAIADSQLSITNDGPNHYQVSITLSRLGSRSSYGDVEVIDYETQERVGLLRNVAVYTELVERRLTVPLKPGHYRKLIVRYTESKRLNDAKIAETIITL